MLFFTLAVSFAATFSGEGNAAIAVALIGLPTQLFLAWATYRKAASADNAVNHRVNGTTISQDILDIKHMQRQQGIDIAWLVREFTQHLKEHARHDDGE